MGPAYQHLALSAVKPGMILSDVLLDKQGQVLLPKGAVLTSRTIALLPSHGIDSLAVLADDDSQEAQAPRDPALVEQRLARLFRKNNPGEDLDWASAELHRLVRAFRLGREEEA